MSSVRVLRFLSVGSALLATAILHSTSSAAPMSSQSNPKAVLDEAWQIVN
jgi:hypothetical protein